MIAALVGLTAVLLGFGEVSAPFRLLAAAAPILLAGLGLLVHERIGLVANFYWLALLAAVPCGVARFFGWTIRQRSAAYSEISSAAGERRGQFTLRQMFGWMTSVAMLAALAKFTELPPLDGAIILGISMIVFGSFVWATAWRTLALGMPGCQLRIIIAASFFLLSFVLFLAERNSLEAIVVGLAAPMTLVVVTFVLLGVRSLGFVYIRVRPAT
jgi:hypothetical protein